MENRMELQKMLIPSEESKDGKLFWINTKLLPFKAHYFFSYGCIAAVVPFLPVVAKGIGMNGTSLGVVFTMISIFNFLSNPIIGFLVDYFQNIKHFLIVMLITSSIAYAFILPPITYEDADATYIRVSRFNESETLLNVTKPFERSCLEIILRNYTECKLVFKSENEIIHNNEANDLNSTINMTYNLDLMENLNLSGRNTHFITFHIDDVFLFEREDIMSPLNVQCSPPIHQCSIIESHDILLRYQLWVYFILVVLASITSTSGSSLTSVACFELLGKNTAAYGRQRLFGTIGWGIICPLSGLLNDHFKSSFIYVLLLMAIFQMIDIIILGIIPLPKAHASSDMSRDLRIIFTSPEIVIFSSGILLIGFLNALISGFEFWFLEDLGATRTLLGLSVLMQCLGEVPFLYFSGWFVSKLGHFLCLACVCVGFMLRLAFYFFLKDPWLVLPVDTLHGITFGLFHGTMADFAKKKAPKGMGATVLGLFGGVYHGLGYGFGSFLGGYSLDKFGPRDTFLSGCLLSLLSFLLLLFASCIFRRKPNMKKIQLVSLEIEEIKSFLKKMYYIKMYYYFK